MFNRKSEISLPEVFPVEKINTLNFGSADGHRDELIEYTFVKTYSAELFERDTHSIIVGPFGAGKSTIFNLLKNKSDHFPTYKKHLIVPIEEQVSFVKLRELVSEYFENLEERRIFQLIWKFQILTKISEQLSNEDEFPKTEEEKRINQFLGVIGSKGHYSNIVEKLKSLMSSFNFRFEATIAENPISISMFDKNKSKLEKMLFNLGNL